MSVSPQQVDTGALTVIDREIRTYAAQRAEYEDAQNRADRAKKAYEEQKDRLWDILEANGMKTVNHELGRVTRSTNVRGIVKDQTALEKSLDDMGILKSMRTLKWKQRELNRIAKESMEGDLPSGLDTLIMKTVTYTPRRPAADAMAHETRD